MTTEINKIELNGSGMAIRSHINEELFRKIDAKKIGTIYFAYTYEEWQKGKSYPDEKDMVLLNTLFKENKHIRLDIDEKWMLPLVPEVERFWFKKYDGESVEFLKKNNTVRSLYFNNSADSKTDLTTLLPFGETLEYLHLDASQYKPYDNIEAVLNGMKKLSKLSLASVPIDFSRVNENSTLEILSYHGSKIKEWEGIVKLTGLKSLTISNNTTVSDLGFLLGLPNLEDANFMYCSRIVRFPDLSGLKKLKNIYALECNRLEDVEELKKLSNVDVSVQGKVLPGKSYLNRPNK